MSDDSTGHSLQCSLHCGTLELYASKPAEGSRLAGTQNRVSRAVWREVSPRAAHGYRGVGTICQSAQSHHGGADDRGL